MLGIRRATSIRCHGSRPVVRWMANDQYGRPSEAQEELALFLILAGSGCD
jgi:hypothetical protein